MPFEDSSVSLVTACQAVHWFDIPKFYNESWRILKPSGLLAVYGYELTKPSLDMKHGQQLSDLVLQVIIYNLKFNIPYTSHILF